MLINTVTYTYLWWKPKLPFCWYKFDGDMTDSTWTFWVASWTSTFQTLDSWLKVLQTDGTNKVLLPTWITDTAITTYTIAFFMKVITTNPTYWYYAWCGVGDNNPRVSFYESTAWRNFVEWGNSWDTTNNRDITPSGIWAWWRLVCFRSNGTSRSNVSLIINWQYNIATWWTSSTDSSSIFWYSSPTHFCIWWRYETATASAQRTSVQFSNFVISHSYWEDAICLEMFNELKSKYWL